MAITSNPQLVAQYQAWLDQLESYEETVRDGIAYYESLDVADYPDRDAMIAACQAQIAQLDAQEAFIRAEIVKYGGTVA